MDSFYPLCIFLIIGHSLSISEAGILDPIRNVNIFDHNRLHDRPRQVNQLLSPFRDNEQRLVNTDYDPNNSRIPFGHQLRSPSFDNPSDARRPFEYPNNSKGLTYNEWMYVHTTQSSMPFLRTEKPPAKNIPHPEIFPNYDEIIAQKFPQAEELLKELKRLDDIKKKQQQDNLSSSGTWPPDRTEPPALVTKKPIPEMAPSTSTAAATATTTTTKPHLNNKTQDVKKVTTDTPPLFIGRKTPMKKLIKRKFYYQAKPVRPEDEINNSNESVYYVDS